MDTVGGIVAYVVIWVVVLFMVLPFGVRQPDETEPGHMPGAPDNPRIGLKFAVTSAIAAAVWGGLYFAVQNGWIGLSAPA
jgi:predicted secreted protein